MKKLPTRKGITDNERARRILNSAIYQGFLPPAKIFKCEDCGNKAEHYDHRDYSKPLEVVPVCKACNNKRGKGIPVIFPCTDTIKISNIKNKSIAHEIMVKSAAILAKHYSEEK